MLWLIILSCAKFYLRQTRRPPSPRLNCAMYIVSSRATHLGLYSDWRRSSTYHWTWARCLQTSGPTRSFRTFPGDRSSASLQPGTSATAETTGTVTVTVSNQVFKVIYCKTIQGTIDKGGILVINNIKNTNFKFKMVITLTKKHCQCLRPIKLFKVLVYQSSHVLSCFGIVYALVC